MKFNNRELSWLAFNGRVLQEAADASNPLLERIRFLGIFFNNLDEFFRIRVAGLRRAASLGRAAGKDAAGLKPQQVLALIHEKVMLQQEEAEKLWSALALSLKRHHIIVESGDTLTRAEHNWLNRYFTMHLKSRLFPILFQESEVMPELKDRAIYLLTACVFKQEKQKRLGVLEIPRDMERFVRIGEGGQKSKLIFVEDIIRLFIHDLYPGTATVGSAYSIKMTRDAELDIDDDVSRSMLEKMTRSLNQRKRGAYVTFSYDRSMPVELLNSLLKSTKIKDPHQLLPSGRYTSLRDLLNFPDFGKKNLRYPPLVQVPHPDIIKHGSVFRAMAQRDLLLHFPYHPFYHITDLLREAATDPMVRSIRITVYRVASDSGIMNALIYAARNGKRVVAVVELQARFDEENNIAWTRRLQEAGVRVIPGVSGLKVHSKIMLISRKEKGQTVRYALCGTGNLHERTAGVYDDVLLLTRNEEITGELRKVFNFFENNYQRGSYRELLVSPFNTRRKLVDLIHNEMVNARNGDPAGIVIKLNHLVDEGMISRLYEASQAGVKVDVIVRGMCALIPGIPGQSENIRVISIVGRFLEHARILKFINGGKPLYYISSADWMLRNLDQRIEVTVPVVNAQIEHELDWYLSRQLAPGTRARIIEEKFTNKFLPVKRAVVPVDPQQATMERLSGSKH